MTADDQVARVDQDAETRTRTPRGAARDAAAPDTVGRYQLTRELGRGGMGVVMEGLDTTLDRRVAIKLLYPVTLADEAAAAGRVEREAQAMARLSHPNVVNVYEVDRGARPFIAMELVAGDTLRAWSKTPRPWRARLRMLIAAGRGLAAAHAVGLVHRDFKPENVLIGPDQRPRVSDFGLVSSLAPVGAVSGEVDQLATGTDGGIVGTPAYMPPEQWAGGEVDHRADQYAFAVTCWEVLWGERPFLGPSLGELRAQVERGTPVAPARRGGVPRRIEATLRRALHPDRAARWPDLPALLQRLERQARDRRPIVAGVAAAVALSAVAVVSLARGGGVDPAAACSAAGDDLDDVWNPGRRQTLAAAFAARPEPYAREAWTDVDKVIDGWVAEQRSLRVETCQARRAGGASVESVTAARERCLDRRAGELTAFLAAIQSPDQAVVQYARAAARGLARPTSCLTAQAVGTDAAAAPLAARAALADAHRRIADSAARRGLGKPREAVAIAEAVAEQADALAWDPLIAEAQLELGLAYQANNANADGERAHQRAALVADAAHDDETRFAAMIGLSIAGIDHSHYDESARHIETAAMIAKRLPPDERRDVTVAVQRSSLLFWQGDYQRCVGEARSNIEVTERLLGPDAIEGIKLRATLAFCLGKLSELDVQHAILDRGLDIAQRTVGHDHPLTAELYLLRGHALAAAGREEEALVPYRESLAIRERVFSEDNAAVGVSLTSLGGSLLNLDRIDEAVPLFERAIRVLEKAWGDDSPAVAFSELALSEVGMRQKRYADAERHARRAVTILRAKRPPGHDELTWATLGLGHALLWQRKPEALTVLEQTVLEMEGSNSSNPAMLALARFRLGRALQIYRGDLARAASLISKACAALETVRQMADEMNACRAGSASDKKAKR